jgi:hypothetical protein
MKRAAIKLIFMALLLVTVMLWLPNTPARAAAPCTLQNQSPFAKLPITPPRNLTLSYERLQW